MIPKMAWKHYNGTKKAFEKGKNWRQELDIIYSKGSGGQGYWESCQGLLHMPKNEGQIHKDNPHCWHRKNKCLTQRFVYN